MDVGPLFHCILRSGWVCYYSVWCGHAEFPRKVECIDGCLFVGDHRNQTLNPKSNPPPPPPPPPKYVRSSCVTSMRAKRLLEQQSMLGFRA